MQTEKLSKNILNHEVYKNIKDRKKCLQYNIKLKENN